jgi:hypothetical protein
MSTTARPAMIIEGSAYRDTNESLKYKDVELFKVWDLEALSKQVFIMRITLRLCKGRRNKG